MKNIAIIVSIPLLLAIVLLGSYSRWNSASPSGTCASCHEIAPSVNIWSESTHRNIACKECHGTALSEGLHSLKEKGSMIFHHNSRTNPEDVRISEVQRLEVMQKCKSCHQTEYAKWNAGGHAMNYSQVFLHSDHNKAERIYDDCLRCHGMFYDQGTVADIVEPLDIAGPWRLKNVSLSDRPAIPCFACHQVHRQGKPELKQNPGTPATLHYSRIHESYAAFYYRRDSSYYPVTQPGTREIYDHKVPVKISSDPLQNLCIQCHSANAFNMAGTGDDRTPRGVHEGISCLACHDPHSNSALASCKNCHPAISNCKIDVEKMNTTYKDRLSKNNIHFVACTDCHIKGRPVPAGISK